MKRIIGIVICILFINVGCANLLRTIVPDSPRPNEDQLKSASKLSETNVTTIAGLQSDKQGKMTDVAKTALILIGTSTTATQAEAITNITANAIKGIKDADGTRKTLGSLQQRTMEEMLRMPTSQFLAGIAAQTVADVSNKEELYKGIEAGFQWTKTNGIGLAISLLGTGGLGSLALRLRNGLSAAQTSLASIHAKNNNLSSLLIATGSAIETWKSSNPDAWKTLKPLLTDAHSGIPLNVKDELGLS